ncbi:MAG: hypothetical protein KGK08_02880 [Acidobacteriota bacterium]|nr:hypothetical protein [Acidobacteriota bacterium]
MMLNQDLVAYLKPIQSRLGTSDRVELVDLTGQVTDVEADRVRLKIRHNLPKGIYRVLLHTRPQAFDMTTASVEMVRVPDGKRVPVGPWDLDHIHNVMALPMARVFVNGRRTGGLWFAMPGPEQIAEGRLIADLGFEADADSTELLLELTEHDRERMGWDRIASIEIREDDRRRVALQPLHPAGPRLFATATQFAACEQRWRGMAEMDALSALLHDEPLVMLTDNSQGTLSLAMIYYAITGDATVGIRALEGVMELAQALTWSGRPDPLLMGGENDRGISLRLFHVALAWDCLQPLLQDSHRIALRNKAEEYLQKMYDFTVLQRAYMGYPAIDPHSLGSWNGTAIACMAFYEELAIARHALPFFHGLFIDSLQLYPASGKAAWATYFPFHLVLYLAAASSFAGPLPEVAASAFLQNLGAALLTCFEAPNSQELQRGTRTREHRFLTAFLHRFCPTPGIEAIYRTFYARELSQAGDVSLGIFDLLYAPPLVGPVADLPQEPLFAREIGDVIMSSQHPPRVSVSMSAGAKAGQRASFTLMPQNREFAPSLGAVEVAVDGRPVLCNLNISSYGIQSALTNTLCLEDGGGVTDGQYLNGAVRPEQNSVIRRYLCSERFVYVHVVLTHALHPALRVDAAERICIFDRLHGVIVMADSFRAQQALQFATHLHCSGRATDMGDHTVRLTGGQAELIAGIKRGSKGLDNDEHGELYATVLGDVQQSQVELAEPTWIPGYIYGLNYTGNEALADARYPRYTRWRLAMRHRTREAELLFALAPSPGMVQPAERGLQLPRAHVFMGPGRHRFADLVCEAECLLWDEVSGQASAMGVTHFEHAGSTATFAVPVDLEYTPVTGQGRVFTSSLVQPALHGLALGAWDATTSAHSNARYHAALHRADRTQQMEVQDGKR